MSEFLKFSARIVAYWDLKFVSLHQAAINLDYKNKGKWREKFTILKTTGATENYLAASHQKMKHTYLHSREV